MSTIMHVDMDAFYASVEIARYPELRDVPMFVGGASRGVVLSANYPARAYGIKGGMPSLRARRLCPQVKVVPPDFDSYSAVSRGIFSIFDTITPKVEAASIDEAFLDITGTARLGTPVQLAERLRAQVADEQRIACSVGIGPSKFIAKLASAQAKPDGVVFVPPESVVSFLHPLPVEAIWGVGEVTAEKLHRYGLEVVADIAHTPRETLHRAFGAHMGQLLFDLSWGVDDRSVLMREPVEHSIGSQETFAKDTDDGDQVATEILCMADRTATRMRAAGMLGRVVTLSVRFADFATITRSVTLSSPTDVTNDVYTAALGLFRKLNLQRARIRRVGVRVEKLVSRQDAYQQFRLDDPDRGWREAEIAIDKAVRRFGPQAVQRATLTRLRSRRPGDAASAPPSSP